MLKEYIKNNILLTDGAMGTYYAQLTNARTTLSEFANIANPDIIKEIHDQYIESGARLIRTNTFSVNTSTLDTTRERIRTLIEHGCKIAKSAAYGRDVFIAADIGPIPDIKNSQKIDNIIILDEYKFIIDTFFKSGIDIFIFETFSSTENLQQVSEYIKNINNDAFILAQFALNINGYTRKEVSANRLQQQIKSIPSIDAYGFNCGVGPTHLHNIIKEMDFTGDIVSAIPNSGYPEIINERTVYTQNPEYFSHKLMDIRKLGIKIIGGCCGTTPLHIKELSNQIRKDLKQKYIPSAAKRKNESLAIPKTNLFAQKLKNNEFITAVELDPPFDSNIDNIIKVSRDLKENAVDIITVADSPMGRVRIDSLMVASKIKREAGIDAMPHICCRDKNIIALKASLLGAYIEGIRNLLIVTGDPVPSPERNEIKSVFNLNSISLIDMVTQMNKETFAGDPYHIGGALNLNVLNKDIEIKRMNNKAKNGASFFLTQPIFTDDAIEYLKKIKNQYSNIKILAGIIPLVSFKNAAFLNNEVPGIDIPEKYINKFSLDMDKEKAEKTGITIAVDIANKVKEYVDGLYFITPFNRTGMIVEIMRILKI